METLAEKSRRAKRHKKKKRLNPFQEYWKSEVAMLREAKKLAQRRKVDYVR
jgi:hypothetical protein